MLSTTRALEGAFPQVAEKFSNPPPRPRRVTFSESAIDYFDSIARNYGPAHRKMDFYLNSTTEFFQSIVPAGKRVLLIGPMDANMLSALKPSFGVGLSMSEEMTEICRQNNRDSCVSYVTSLPESYTSTEKFDFVLLYNTVDHCGDVLLLIDSLKPFLHADSKIVMTMLNPLWHGLVRLASRLKIRISDYERNVVASRIFSSALEIKRFKVNGTFRRLLLPRNFFFVSYFLNQFVARLPLFNSLCFTQYVIATPDFASAASKPSCSVIIPCFNEEGNVEECIRRVPNMGSFTEVLVVDDGSRDKTLQIAEEVARHDKRVRVLTYGKNKGKGMAVLEGMQKSRGDIMMILDADMTVPPEELNEFYDALASRSADFAMGTRFLYPMEKKAMRFANYLGNMAFSKLVEIIVGSPCSDTLCGTKAMRREDFKTFRIEDSAWGDFDLIFHAAKAKLRCMEIPVHYMSRVAGESKMRAFRAAITFLRLCFRKWAELP